MLEKVIGSPCFLGHWGVFAVREDQRLSPEQLRASSRISPVCVSLETQRPPAAPGLMTPRSPRPFQGSKSYLAYLPHLSRSSARVFVTVTKGAGRLSYTFLSVN